MEGVGFCMENIGDDVRDGEEQHKARSAESFVLEQQATLPQVFLTKKSVNS